MTEITWINSAEQLPPNTMKFELIYRVKGEIKFGFGATFNPTAAYTLIHPVWWNIHCSQRST